MEKTDILMVVILTTEQPSRQGELIPWAELVGDKTTELDNYFNGDKPKSETPLKSF